MTDWAARRFWTDVALQRGRDGWEILLDTRPVRTPSKHPLAVPTEALARMIAAEWEAQQGKIDPGTMPATRYANSAIEKVAPQRDGVIDVIAAYGETDLLCYRAPEPDALIARQAAAWDPLLAWAEATLGARLVPTVGVLPVAQDAGGLAVLRARVAAMDNFQLAAFHDLVALSGSLVIGFAAVAGQSDPATLWEVSRIDESWQVELWGEDAEAAEANRRKGRAFQDAHAFFVAGTGG